MNKPKGLTPTTGSLLTTILLLTVGLNAEADFEIRYAAPSSGASNSIPESGLSCKAIQDETPDAPSGYYEIKITDDQTLTGYCDMDTGDGGWLLVLDYLHRGGTNPPLNPRNSELPRRSTGALGDDGSSTSDGWMHAGGDLLEKLDPNEVRFECQTSGHSRKMNFKTTDRAFITSIWDTQNDAALGSWKTFPDNTAFLPDLVDDFYTITDRDKGLTLFPFYKGGTYHWGIRGHGDRWECDDYPNSYNLDTLHRVWIR